MEAIRLEQQMAFILEMDRLKSVFRQNYLADGSRRENDTEHSWHLAIMAILLHEYADEPVDLLKVLKMVLIHDIIELDAGDTYAYDSKANESKRAREIEAARRIFGMLPEDQGKEFRAIWDEFEEAETQEARFANSLDRLQPLMLNIATKGSVWQAHNVSPQQVYDRNKVTKKGSTVLGDYVNQCITESIQKGYFNEE